MTDADVFRRFHQAWTDDDLETVLELTHPQAVARPVFGMLFEEREYRGRDGIAQWFREMKAPWDTFETRVEDVWETPDGVVGFLHLVGHRGDQEFDARVASECEVLGGKVFSLTARDVAEAQEDLFA